MSALRRWAASRVSDPITLSSWIAGAMIAGAFVAFFLAWRGVAATLAVPLQLPYFVSGGIAGMTLLVVGVALLLAQSRRRRHMRECRRLEQVLVEANELLDVVAARAERRAASPSRARRRR